MAEADRSAPRTEQAPRAVFTSVTKSHLASARVLMHSVRRQMPGWRRFVLLADEVDGCFDPAEEPFETVEAQGLPVPDFRRMAFRYGPMELCCALKPWGLRYLLEERGFGRALYLDSDVELYSPLSRIEEALEERNIALTPHLASPLRGPGEGPPEDHILRDGTYNGGLVGVRDSETSRSFLNWWAEKVAYDCVVDRERGLMYDQKWLDMVPALFAGVEVLRDAGYNVAYWNLANRPVTRGAAGEWLAGGTQLAFFHFSYFRPGRELPFGPVGPRRESLASEVSELLDGYAERLRDAGYEECAAWPYAYGAFGDGTPVHPAFREFHREVLYPRGLGAPEDPFDPKNGTMPALTGRWRDSAWVGAVAALYRFIVATGDRHPSAPLHGPVAFAEWCSQHGEETGVGERFVSAQRELLASFKKGGERPPRHLTGDALALLKQGKAVRVAGLCSQLSRTLHTILSKPPVRFYRAVKSALKRVVQRTDE
ncbi:MAG: hypothetical protein R6X33_03385 [Candidatus Brocadiia bacterium]